MFHVPVGVNDVEIHYEGRSVALELDDDFDLRQFDVDGMQSQLLTLGAGVIKLVGTDAGTFTNPNDNTTVATLKAPWTFTIENYDPENPVLVKFPDFSGNAPAAAIQTVETEVADGAFAVERDPTNNHVLIFSMAEGIPGSVPIWQSWQVTPSSAACESLYSLNASSSRKPFGMFTS